MSDEATERTEYLRVPAMGLSTVPDAEWARVKQSWDYVRHGTMGLAIQRILREDISGDMAEVGVWRGDCARFIHSFCPTRKLYLFDTFEGFPEVQGRELDPRFDDVGFDPRFRDTSLDIVRETVGNSENIVLRPGFFPDSTSGLEESRFAFVSLDLDTFEGISDGLAFFYPRLNSGGYMFIHDYNATEYNWGPFRATNAFLKDKSESVVEIPDQWGSAVFRKHKFG